MNSNVNNKLNHGDINKHSNFIGLAEDLFVMYGEEQNEKMHRHYWYQLLIPTNKLEINGEITEGQVLIGSYIDHIVHSDSKILSLLIKPESDIGRRIKYYYFQKEPIINFDNPQLDQQVKTFSKDVTVENIQKVATLVLHQLLSDTNPANKPDSRITKMINYIQSNHIQDLSYQDFMSSVFLSKSHLANLFKKEMDIPVMKYLTWKKLIFASKNLAASNKTITEVAHQYGFSDAAHFSRVFKENFGTSPKRIFQSKHKTSISFMFL